MSEEPYLIAHLVSGITAFDIAIKLCDATTDELCQPNCGFTSVCKKSQLWLIPTSGHRAHPFYIVPLKECLDIHYMDGEVDHPMIAPPDWPDHYSANDRAHNKALQEDMDLAMEAARPGEGLITDIASILNLIPKQIIRRR